MQNQNNPIVNNIEQLNSKVKQKQENSLLNSANPDLVEVTDLIAEIGKNVVDFASTIFDGIDINL